MDDYQQFITDQLAAAGGEVEYRTLYGGVNASPHNQNDLYSVLSRMQAQGDLHMQVVSVPGEGVKHFVRAGTRPEVGVS